MVSVTIQLANECVRLPSHKHNTYDSFGKGRLPSSGTLHQPIPVYGLGVRCGIRGSISCGTATTTHIRRFLETKTTGLLPEMPIFYAYVQNSPVNSSDPLACNTSQEVLASRSMVKFACKWTDPVCSSAKSEFSRA